MILVFGGTTEGRKAVKELEESGKPFYYSTKGNEQEITLKNGIRLEGALLKEDMLNFCKKKNIRLLIDAAHPFATHLHQTVAEVAEILHLPAIRFERIFPSQHTNHITWCADYADAINKINVPVLLATTGVQSISQLKPLEEKGVKIYYRILERDSSIKLARQQGVKESMLCYYHQGENELNIFRQIHPDAILLKDSGETGGFNEKIRAAEELNLQIFAISRPTTPKIFTRVNGEHGLRRMVEKLLPDFYTLHSGLTTGSYATAAAVAATQQLLQRKGNGYILSDTIPENTVPIILPNGETIYVPVTYGKNNKATVIKDSGDDPDVTNGVEIIAEVSYLTDNQPNELIRIKGGEGIGHITLPGFDYPVGEAAINKVPRQMIQKNIISQLYPEKPLLVTISIPKGKELAKRTFNPRLGITDGISVVGVSGIIKPFSKEGFLNSIRKCMDVAKATGCDRIVINSGAKSEGFVKAYYPELPAQVFVEYGNFIGETIKLAQEMHIPNVTLGIMMGKAVKLAEGNLDTHSKKVTMNKEFIKQMAREAGCDESIINEIDTINLARELWEKIPANKIEDFCETIIHHCHNCCDPLLPDGKLSILIIGEKGDIHATVS
ncbi:MAG: cobalt-precorrin-5B (C(1))-methyltransferase CbiD [Phocaeicola sp.]|uniref:cobalt-precorrin-5B (C(1))-methyltransferase CbiD n=1 Tax=Phocaeicola TaxID=909656 RepID=UPI00234E8F5F|nr:cobalt-precorrin-5B (C(1))-methyltransferase CbiD [Phocaeicola oris]MCE2615558.1 cobalt-precorrin-5B (C(1))-methyltransferase CbiD [Phocaeicola oris]